MKSLVILSISLATLGLFFAPPLSAQWEPDVRLTYNDSVSFTSRNNARCIATGPDQTVHIVWYDNRDGNYEIYYKRSNNSGLRWAPDRRLTHALRESAEPSIAVSGETIHLVWRDDRDEANEIYYRRSTNAGRTWLGEVRLTNDTSQSCNPSIAASGPFVHLAWEERKDGKREIFYKRSADNGASWSTDTSLTGNLSISKLPSIAIFNTMVHVVWQGGMGGADRLYYNRSTDQGITWERERRIAPFPSYQWYPSISALGTYVHVTWTDILENQMMVIYYTRSTDSGASWDSSRQRLSCISGARNSAIAASGANVHVAWSAGYRPAAIYYSHSENSGASWVAETSLTSGPLNPNLPSIATLGVGVHLVWSDDRDSIYFPEIYYKRNVMGNPSASEEESETVEQQKEQPLKPTPNPFCHFATLPAFKGIWFELYDIAGRKVGTYRGDRIGANLPAGVYFLKYQEMLKQPMNQVQGMVQHDEIVRIVKLR